MSGWLASSRECQLFSLGSTLSTPPRLCWASHLIFVAKGKFSWKDLERFFTSGPALLKEIYVQKIVIIEPLQGDRLAIPIRFIASYEVSQGFLQWLTRL